MIIKQEKKIEVEKDSFKSVMYEYTEWPGDLIPYDDLHFISHRYNKVLGLCDSKDILEIGAGRLLQKRNGQFIKKLYRY